MRQFFLCLFFMVCFVHLSFESAHAQAVCDPNELTTRVSVASDGTQENEFSRLISGGSPISADGRYLTYASFADNLVNDDTNDKEDAFVYNRLTCTTTRISVASDETQGNHHSSDASISSSGRYIAMSSYASNLVADDTNETSDIFVHDRDLDNDGIFDETGAIQIVRVSVASDGTQANGWSDTPVMSADGRYVAFRSGATNLVSDDTNYEVDIFIHDRDVDNDGIFDEPGAIQTLRVSVTSDGTQSQNSTEGTAWSQHPSISDDGRYVAFQSAANNLVSDDTNICHIDAGISGECPDIFVHDLETHQTTRVSAASDGTDSNGLSADGGLDISSDGRYVIFDSHATNLVDETGYPVIAIFIHDRQTHETTRLPIPLLDGNTDGGFFAPVISSDERYVSFISDLENLVLSDTNNQADIFVFDRQTEQTLRVNIAYNGAQANGYSNAAALSADGKFVVFESAASNLVADDTNSKQDIFLVPVHSAPAAPTLVAPADNAILSNPRPEFT